MHKEKLDKPDSNFLTLTKVMTWLPKERSAIRIRGDKQQNKIQLSYHLRPDTHILTFIFSFFIFLAIKVELLCNYKVTMAFQTLQLCM